MIACFSLYSIDLLTKKYLKNKGKEPQSLMRQHQTNFCITEISEGGQKKIRQRHI